ncbi:hypothetical protein VOLCADRAFT_87615 [Volvox carteri f. nagariensis]|uniref:PB1 domain-containing protein n=1 Tax=Volvox carteri f. nagariensis TaxID=3068 RepID=D8TLS9_VOLCA|nr:uncharacterized protein VOLCADRAFT_87615 [Volvox carteri f. nagariensis]EFJ51384.1 hypothetical protein VOLCADRAFT_87615 [Volvox carteri f. nagariensis]|eukprot:XP_002947336.1 hypothetical protein VOLCADRAFT_87615 [Volvox carteri f. nagariensis]
MDAKNQSNIAHISLRQDLAASWSCNPKEDKTGRLSEVLACATAPPALPGVASDVSNTTAVNAVAAGATAAGGGVSGAKPAVATVDLVGGLLLGNGANAAGSVTGNATALKGGDDFESMFTPLSSLPVAKSETPKAGVVSRASGFQPGPHTSLQIAAAGTGPPAATAHDAGGHSQGVERKGPLKKASRVLDGRGSAGQPGALGAAAAAAAGATSDQTEATDHASVGRSRTPVPQFSPVSAAAATPGTAKETTAGGASAGAAAVAAAAAASKTQSQSSQPQPQGQGQPAQQQPQQPAMATQQLQQRASWGKHLKDGAKEGARLRESGDGAAPPVTGLGSLAAGPAVGTGGGLSAVGSRGGDRPPAPASAGSTPAAAPAHSGGEVGERKRPRSEGSKPKAGTSLTGDPHGSTENAWPYGETLADRIKRTKRATTSSSEQEGPQSHGGSAERPISHAAYAGNGATPAGGEGQSNAAVAGGARPPGEPQPRPAISAEAQSRGTEPSAPARNPSRGPQAAASTVPGGDAAASTAVGGGAKQQQQQRHQAAQQGRDKLGGRSEDSPAAMQSRSGGQIAEKPPDALMQNPVCNSLRVSGGGAVTDSSGVGGVGPAGAQRASGPSAGAKTAGGTQAPPGVAVAGPGGTKRPTADAPLSRRHNGPPAKLPRSDPHLPRPSHPHGQDRRSAGPAEVTAMAAAVGGNARTGAALPPPPSLKPTHRTSSGTPAGKADGAQGPVDGAGPPTCATGLGQVPSPAGPSPPGGRLGRLGDNDMPAAGSCKGPAVAGSRGSKDGAGDKGACGPRNGGHVVDAACGGTGGGGAGAAATTTTEPKTDSDTRTSRVVECYFEFDPPCRVTGGAAPISGLVPVGPLPVGHGFAARLGNGRVYGGPAAAAALYPRGGSGAAAAMAAAASQLLDLGKIRSFKELWTQLAALHDGSLPDEMDSKIIYLDEEGDWIMVTPDEPWSSVAAAATKVLVTNRT